MMGWDEDELAMKRSLLKDRGLILIKGNPKIPNAVNGYSLLNSDRECEYTELSWWDLLRLRDRVHL